MFKIKFLLSKLTGNNNILSNNVLFIDYTGNHEKAQFLSQLIYWSDRTKLKDEWFAVSYDEWFNQIRVKEHSIRRFTKSFKDLNLIETKVKKFAGRPVLHYRVNFEVLVDELMKFCNDSDPDNLQGCANSEPLQSDSVEADNLQESTLTNCNGPYTKTKTEIKTKTKIDDQQKVFESEELEVYSFEEFWNDYGKKNRKEAARKEWKKLKVKEILKIKENLPKYVESTPKIQFRLNPSRYLNEKVFNDEIQEQTNSSSNESNFQQFTNRAQKYS